MEIDLLISVLLGVYCFGTAFALAGVMIRMYLGHYPETSPGWLLVRVQYDVFGWPIRLFNNARRTKIDG